MSNETNSNRRSFLKGLFGAAVTGAAAAEAAPIRYLKPMEVENPLAAYPNRDWEKTYRNIF
jgi:nitrate reductase alpha subunit